MSDELVVSTAKDVQVNISMDDVKKYIAPGATDKELFMFMNISKSYGLNPFKREVHWVKYGNNPGQIIVGYETYLKRAERTGLLDGWKCWIEGEKQEAKAVIEIYRKDHSQPFRWEVYREEFDKGQSVWKQMWRFMLKKVAISQGFRLAFPEEMGGMPYIPEEINGRTSEDLPKTEILEPTKEDVAFLDRCAQEITTQSTSDSVTQYIADNSIAISESPFAEQIKQHARKRFSELVKQEKAAATSDKEAA